MTYWDREPPGPHRPREVEIRLADLSLRLRTEAGVFGATRLDHGTDVLLRKAPTPAPHSAVVDLGTGYGPIATVLARRQPTAGVLAVDVNRRALRLAADNAMTAGATNVVVMTPDVVPSELRLDGLYSNPPIKIGKTALHELLLDWLARLGPGTAGWLVVKQSMGADTLQGWLSDVSAPTTRVASKQGYRVLRVDTPGDRRPPLDETIRDAVARTTGGSWTVLGRLTGGPAEQVFLLQRRKIRAALKVVEGSWWWPQLQRLEPIVDQLRAAGHPTPEIIAAGQVAEDRAFLMTELVHGARPTALDRAQLDALLDAVEIQRDVCPPPERDWSAMVTLFLNGGLTEQQFLPELQDLTRQAIAGLSHPVAELPSGSFVHGDFSLHNVRFADGALAGIVDLDAFGRGTPVIDLMALLAAVPDVALRRLIVDRAVAMTSTDVVRACLCHRVLAGLSWATDHPQRLPGASDRAARILALLP